MANVISRIPEPAVSRRALMISAGLFWIIGASVLIIRGYLLLSGAGDLAAILIGAAIIIGAIKYRLVFAKTVRKNAERIRELAPHKDKVCIFAFQSMQSYLLVIGMIALGFGLRLFLDFPKTLGTAYIAVGAALILGALQYFSQAQHS